jgi:hypothetical protein
MNAVVCLSPQKAFAADVDSTNVAVARLQMMFFISALFIIHSKAARYDFRVGNA